ncbi:MAG TPA: hypothetical protein VMX14_04750 [Anaerolineae bacterium]|nr:hypothetical protein [Anaerolineae bacterium]
MTDNQELRIGVYVCGCGSNIAGVIDPAEVAESPGALAAQRGVQPLAITRKEVKPYASQRYVC